MVGKKCVSICSFASGETKNLISISAEGLRLFPFGHIVVYIGSVIGSTAMFVKIVDKVSCCFARCKALMVFVGCATVGEGSAVRTVLIGGLGR